MGRTMARPDSRITLWLAGPQAAACFDPASQTNADQQRWRQIRSERRRLDWAVSRALLARAAPPAGHAVSLSHSNGHAAVAVAPAGVRLGVDLEFTRVRDVASLAQLAFSSRERADLQRRADSERIRHFYTLWTLKEALAKALRVDLQRTLQGCEILATPDGWQARCDSSVPWQAQVYAPNEQLILSVVRMGRVSAVAESGAPLQREWPQRGLSPWKRIATIQPEPAASPSRPGNLGVASLALAASGTA
jgi:4'-phosphopantetheinyl transferase